MSYARADAPPLLLLQGTDDRIVYPLHSQLLLERMNVKNGRAKRVELEGVNHFEIVLALSEPFAHLAPNLLPSIMNFIQERIDDHTLFTCSKEGSLDLNAEIAETDRRMP